MTQRTEICFSIPKLPHNAQAIDELHYMYIFEGQKYVKIVFKAKIIPQII